VLSGLERAPLLLIGALLFAADGQLFDTVRNHIAAQRYPQALAAVDVFLRRSPDDIGALKLKGDIHYLLGEDAKAEQAFLSAVRLDPQYEEAQYSLGRIYYQQSRYSSAIEQFQKVLELQPKSFKAYDNIGLCYEHLGDYERAIRNYLNAIELVHQDARDYDWPYANLANLMINRAEYKKGFNLAVEAAQRNPHSARNFYLAAKALTNLDQWDKSFRWLKRSIELDPEYPEPRYLLARLLRKQGKIAEADQEFARFKELRDKAPAKLR
jgi:tetratricopeptide (TPR) repeat protein